MANLLQTSSQVGIGGSTTYLNDEPMQAGEGIVEGNPVYQKALDGKWYKTNAATSTETAGSGPKRVRIALTPASTDEYFSAVVSGPIKIGATTVVGKMMYAISATTGAICELGDLTTGNKVTLLGVSPSSGIINVDPKYTGITL